MSSLGFRVSRGVRTTISPPIPLAYQWAARYKPHPGLPLLDMSQGVPGIPPPPMLQAALGAAASSPRSFGYCSWDGEVALRRALASEMKAVYGQGTDVNESDVALTAGCNLAFVAAMMTLVDAGDEVILPVPWYFNHPMTLNLLGVHAVPLQTDPEDGFIPSVEKCRELITPKTKAILLVTPNNPTGATYPAALIESFAKLARSNHIALVVDETYRDFLTTGYPPHNLFNTTISSSWRDTFIHLFSFSKAYCLPGHRLGAIVASPSFLLSVKTVLDCLQICPPRPIQLALAENLPTLRRFVQESTAAIAARHSLFRDVLPKGWRIGSQGGYFAFVEHPFARVHAVDVSRRLAVEMGVVTLPARFFSESKREATEIEANDSETWKEEDSEVTDRWIRFSVANVSDEQVRKVCERLGQSESVFGWKIAKKPSQ